MNDERTAQVGRALCWLFYLIAALTILYVAWLVLFMTHDRFSDRLLVGVAYLMLAVLAYGAGRGFRAALVDQ